MKIDSHQHFWKFDSERDSWIDDTMQVLRIDYLPQNLYPLLNENEIDGTVAVQADQSESETIFLLDLAEQHEWIRAVVGWIDLCDPKVETRLNYFSEKPNLRGFRHIVQSEPDNNYMLKPEFQNGIELLSKYGFTYDILIFPKQLPSAIQLVEKHPEQIFILDHMAKPLIKNQQIEPWASEIKKLGLYKNLYCKISGIITEADHNTWSKEDIFPYLDIIFNAFEIDRLMFGSDWPVCLLAGSYKQVIKLLEDYVTSFSEEEKEKLFGDNAVKAYGIDLSSTDHS